MRELNEKKTQKKLYHLKDSILINFLCVVFPGYAREFDSYWKIRPVQSSEKQRYMSSNISCSTKKNIMFLKHALLHIFF